MILDNLVLHNSYIVILYTLKLSAYWFDYYEWILSIDLSDFR